MATLALDNRLARARVHCPICTHTVEADVAPIRQGWNRKARVVEGQKCRRCSTWLDAAWVLDVIAPLNG